MALDPAAVKVAIKTADPGPLKRAARKWLATQGDEDAAADDLAADYAKGDVVSRGRRVGVVLDLGDGEFDPTVAVLRFHQEVDGNGDVVSTEIGWRLRNFDGDSWEPGGTLPPEVTQVPRLRLRDL